MKCAFFFLKLCAHLPHSILHLLAMILGRLSYYLIRPRRKVGETNLRLCFPNQTEQWRKSVLKQHFYHMALMILEYGICWYGTDKQLKDAVRYQDKHFLDDALEKDEKVILLYPHFTCLEMGVGALNQDVPFISIYSHQKNKDLDEQLLRGRNRFNNVFLIGRTEGLRSIIKQIKISDAPFLYLPDQDFGAKDSVFAPFFGVQAATITALSRIAKLAQASVIPMIPKRQKDGSIVLQFYPKWLDFPSNDLLTDATRMNQFIEQRVLEIPEQYYWLHKRFKTRPEGEAALY